MYQVICIKLRVARLLEKIPVRYSARYLWSYHEGITQPFLILNSLLTVVIYRLTWYQERICKMPYHSRYCTLLGTLYLRWTCDYDEINLKIWQTRIGKRYVVSKASSQSKWWNECWSIKFPSSWHKSIKCNSRRTLSRCPRSHHTYPTKLSSRIASPKWYWSGTYWGGVTLNRKPPGRCNSGEHKPSGGLPGIVHDFSTIDNRRHSPCSEQALWTSDGSTHLAVSILLKHE